MDAPTQAQTFIAIDPGGSGGFAWKTSSPSGVLTRKMPETEGDILDFLRSLGCMQLPYNGINPPLVFLEQVGGYVGVAQPASSAFNFGHNAGFLRGVCMALGYRVELVRPQKWQAPLGLGSSKAAGSKSAWKNKLKACAQRMFPGTKVTLDTADALLILDWGMREHKEIK